MRALHLFCRADVEEKHASLSSNLKEAGDLPEMRNRNISIYCALVIGTFLLALAGAGSFLYVGISASQKLHNRMFENLLGATIYFFDTNPVGKCCLFPKPKPKLLLWPNRIDT